MSAPILEFIATEAQPSGMAPAMDDFDTPQPKHDSDARKAMLIQIIEHSTRELVQPAQVHVDAIKRYAGAL